MLAVFAVLYCVRLAYQDLRHQKTIKAYLRTIEFNCGFNIPQVLQRNRDLSIERRISALAVISQEFTVDHEWLAGTAHAVRVPVQPPDPEPEVERATRFERVG